MTSRRSLRYPSAVGRPAFGLVQTRPSSLLVETALKHGYDFLFVDQEHGVFSEPEYLQTLQAVASTPLLAMARLAAHDARVLQRCLIAGADVIVAPHVSTATQAQMLAGAMRSSDRAVTAALFVIIESAEGVANAEEILRVDGIDGAFLGPSDFSADLGCRGDYSQPGYADALARVPQIAANAGKSAGTAIHGSYSAGALCSLGYNILVLDTDKTLMSEAMKSSITRAIASLEAPASRS